MTKKIKNLLELTYSYLLGRVVERTGSKINSCLEVTHINGKYMLNSLHANYSYGMLQRVFDSIFKKINIKKHSIKDALILGFGAGSVASLLQEKYKINCNITGIEKDEQVISLGHKYFNIQRFTNTEIICADAYNFMMENKKHFDLIIVDVYVDNLVPENIESEQFLSQLKNSINDKGLIIFNKMIFDEETDKSSKKLYETFSKVMCKFQYHKIHKHHTNLMLVYEHNAFIDKTKLPPPINSLRKMF